MVKNGSVTKVMIIFLAITLVSSSFTAFSSPVLAAGPGTFIDVFVTAGSGGLFAPDGFTFGPDGNLYVNDESLDSVLRYDGATGAFIDIFVTAGSGGLNGPTGLSFEPDGKLYVTSYKSDEVLRYDGTTGAFIDAFVTAGSGGLNEPYDLLFGPDGNLYVSSYKTDKVKRYDGTTGAFIDNFVSAGSGGLNKPYDLLFGPDGNFYVVSSQSSEILRYQGLAPIPDTPPTVSISSPSDGSSIITGSSVTFTGTANDAEDGNLDALLNWNSDLDGAIGAAGSFSTSTLSIGNHSITADVTDSFGNSASDSISVTITVDSPPTVNITFPDDNDSYVAGTPITFSGSATDPEDGGISNLIIWTSDDDGLIGIGSSITNSSLSVGSHVITASVTDSFGNTDSHSHPIMVTAAVNNPPTVSITTPADNDSYVVGTSITFSGSATDIEDGGLSNTISWTSNVDGSIGVGGSFSMSTLTIGTHTITATVTDSDGNTVFQSNTITVNLGGTPTLSISEPADSFVSLDGSSITFSASAVDPEDGGLSNLIFWTSDIDGSIGVGGSWSMSTLSVGTHTITATVSDSDFNTSTISITIDVIVEEATTWICHFPPGNPANYHDKMIGPSALIAHKAHGDKLGSCLDDEDEREKLIKIKKHREETRDKNILKEKRNELKEIKKDLNDLKKDYDGLDKQKIKILIDEIKKVIKKLNENPEYDKEFKQILKDEFKETKLKIKQEMTAKEKIFKHKIDSKVHSLAKSDNPQSDAKKLGFDFKDGKTKIVIKLSDDNSEIVDYLSSLGTVDVKNDKHVQLTIKVSDLPKLYSINGIDKIRPPYSAVQFYEELSEGVYFINADLAQFAGITGEGVKIAVLDLAFSDNEKISDNVVKVKSFRQGIGFLPIQGNEGEASHGTAVAEIITDVAPDVELYLYSMETDIEFTAAVDEAISQQVDIIAMSAGWPNFPTDGTSHITKKIEDAVDNGIVFVVPAGNFANKHWEGSFVDSNFNNWHDYSDSDEGLSFTVTEERIEEEKPIIAHLMWDVGNGDVADFELVLVDPLGQIVDYSANEQLTKSDTPFEYIHHIPEIEGTYSLGVLYAGDMSKVSQRPSATLEIFSINDELEHPVSQSSVSVPADADGAIVVGAINHLDGVLEPFSSQGPTNNGKLAPHVVGPDGVTTLAFNGDPFYGTSATAPYVAGLAALILQNYPDISPNELLTKIQQNTDSSLFSFQNGYDYSSGYGSANAFFLIEEQGVLG